MILGVDAYLLAVCGVVVGAVCVALGFVMGWVTDDLDGWVDD